MLNIKNDIWKKAVSITNGFENGKGSQGYSGISGNFDGAFLSLGVLQWQFLSGTLQPLFFKLFNNFPQVAKNVLPNSGKDLLNALNNKTEKKWALSIQKNNIVIDPWKTALINLGKTPEFQSIQDEEMKYYRDGAVKLCNQFNLTTDRAFCLFFDIMVQSGSLKFYQMAETQYLDRLKSIATVVSMRANPRWANDVLIRKMCIVNGGGIVHGDSYKFDFNDLNSIVNIDDATVNAINILVNKKIIRDPQYWIEGTSIGDIVAGEYAAVVIQKSAAIISKNSNINLRDSLQCLYSKKIFGDLQYWIDNTIQGGKVNGEFMAIIIKNIVKNI